MKRLMATLCIIALFLSACGARASSDDGAVTTTSLQTDRGRVSIPSTVTPIYIPAVDAIEDADEIERRRYLLTQFVWGAARVQGLDRQLQKVSASDFDERARNRFERYFQDVTRRWQKALNTAQNETHWFEVRDILNRLVVQAEDIKVAIIYESIFSAQTLVRELLKDEEFVALVVLAISVMEEIAAEEAEAEAETAPVVSDVTPNAVPDSAPKPKTSSGPGPM